MKQQLTKSGYPSDRRRVPEGVCHYWNVRDQVHEVEGLMFLGEKVIFDYKSQRVHRTWELSRIKKTNARAREAMY